MSDCNPTFRAWLKRNGAEILPVKSAWETVRFRAQNTVHVVYENQKGRIKFSSPSTGDIYRSYEQGDESDGALANRKREKFDLIDHGDVPEAWA